MEGEINEINVEFKIPFHKRTSLNYTHTVNIDSQIKSITSWRKSKIKFNITLIKNILSLGILHIVSLFYPKLYIKLYCKACPPKESDFFLIEEINGNSSLCKSIHKRTKPINSSLSHNINSISKQVTFEYNTIKYEYEERTNTILPIYFNLSLITNNNLVYKYSEGLNSEEVTCLNDRYGKNEMLLNKNIIYVYFIKQNLFQVIMISISSVFFILGGEVGFGEFLFCLSILVLVIRTIFYFIRFKSLYSDDNSLDGQKHMKKYKVIRRNIDQSQSKYSYIYNNSILPGDVLLLKEGEFIPCDGVILEGECILSVNHLMGNTDLILKSSLENNNDYFNYIKNKKNIVFHGMKIMKIYTKNNTKEITVLAINTGPNTFKANLFSNLKFKKDKKYFKSLVKSQISIYYLLFCIILFIISTTTLIIFRFTEKNHNSLKNYILNILGLILMPINLLIENLIKLISIIHLNSSKIHCTNDSFLPESGKIETVIFSKSGNKTEYKIIAFCPLYFEPETKKISIKGYGKSEEENINKILDSHMKYYRKIAINMDNERDDGFKSLNNDAKNEELNALFLQCLVCCTSLEKVNNEICGEIMDKEILEKMDWDINSIEIRNELNDNLVLDNKEETEKIINIIEEIKKKGNIFISNYNNNINYNSLNTISEVFPKDYYKITEEKNINYRQKKSKAFFNKMISNEINPSESKIFKLIIIHRFYNSSCWNKSCITYNLLDNKCYFMTKGPPDKILKHCTPKNIPEIDKLLSRLIKNGYKIITYATKIVQLYQIDKTKNEDHYMKDLSFVGFIIIDNEFKKDICQVIERIDKINCSSSISSVICTNDNIYNAIEGGLKSSIVNKNNVYAFDIGKTEDDGKIIFAKYIYDKEDNQSNIGFKHKNLESNKALIKSIYGEKNTFQNINASNYKKEKKATNEEFISSPKIQDSSRKMINTDSNRETTENNIINSNTLEEEKPKNNFNFFRSPYPSRAFKKKESKYFMKNNTNNFNLNERDHTPSFYFSNKKNLSLTKTDELKEQNEENDLALKYRKRRPTTKANLHFTFRNNFSYTYECLFFRKYENQITPFKHDCILCFSGKLINYIYNIKEKNNEENGFERYILDILMTLLKDRVRVFYSMTPEDKSMLIKIYRTYLNKSVCFVGNSASDIESITLSNIGIMVGPPTNFNTLFSHYYLCDKSLLNIEKILKNGRSYYENISHLLSVNSIFTLLFVVLIVYTYKLDSSITSIRCSFINGSIFLLCLSGFSISPDYSIDINPLVMNTKLFLIYNIIKLFGTIIIKAADNILFFKYYKNNEENSNEVNNDILATYLFILTWIQIISVAFSYNIQSFYRKNIFNNILFIFIFFMIFEYLIVNLTLSDISIGNYNKDLLISFKSNKSNVDSFEDKHKINILYILLFDVFSNYLLIKILRIIFEKLAEKKFKK